MIKWFRKTEDEREKLLKCWRRLALMAGVATSEYYGSTFNSIIRTIKDLQKEGKDVFEGLVKAAKPCNIDNQFLKHGDLTDQSILSLRSNHDLYKIYADAWMDITKELEELRNTWLSRGNYLDIEAIYALGLAILLASAKAAGKDVNNKAVETALWLIKLSMQDLFQPIFISSEYLMSIVIELLYPLRELHKSEWAYLISSAILTGIVRIQDSEFFRERFNEIYKDVHDLEDWAKAILVSVYIKMATETKVTADNEAYLDNACSILNGIRDYALKLIASAHLYNYLVTIEKRCLSTDPCNELELVLQGLEDLRLQVSLNPRKFLNDYLGLRKYLEWNSLRPEENLDRIIRSAQVLTLLSLGFCALRKDQLEMAKDYFNWAANVSRELDYWINYLIGRELSIRAMALRGESLEHIIEELEKLLNEALQKIRSETISSETVTSILGNYIITLALTGDIKYALNTYYNTYYSMGMNIQLDVVTRLILNYLGASIIAPSDLDILKAVKEYVIPEFQPALEEILDAVSDVQKECEKSKSTDIKLCIDAYNAVNGNKETEERIKQMIIARLCSVNIPCELIEITDIKQLIEVYALTSPLAHFILLLRALVLGNKKLALLHAEMGRVLSEQRLVKRLFNELAAALRSNDDYTAKFAIARLYYYYF